MEKKYMEIALREAEKAYNTGEVPVGAVIIKDNKVIAKAHNMVEKKKNSIMHAEIIAISKASKKLKNWRLIDCEMYVTLEPCLMCKSAIELCRLKKVYYSTSKTSNIIIQKDKYSESKSFLKETLKLIQDFFKKRR